MHPGAASSNRCSVHRNLPAILDHLAVDEMVANFFSVDFQTLDPTERTVLEEAAQNQGATRADLAAVTRLPDDSLDGILYGLQMLGYITAQDGRHRLSNWFFERWLRRVMTSRAEART